MVAISRFLSGSGRLVFDPKFVEVVEHELKASKATQGWKNIHKQIADSFVKAEQVSVAENPSLLKSMQNYLTTLPGDMKTAWKNSTGFGGKAIAIGKEFWKRMPLIGGALMVLFELPNILSAFKDKGLVGGLVETAKSGSRLIGSMAGFAIGQALIPIPILGGLIGGFAGDWLVSKIVGKSHTEKKAEAEERQMAVLQQAQQAEQSALQHLPPQQGINSNQSQTFPPITTPQMTLTPQELMAMKQKLYGGGLTSPMDQDFMAMTSGINSLNYLG